MSRSLHRLVGRYSRIPAHHVATTLVLSLGVTMACGERAAPASAGASTSAPPMSAEMARGIAEEARGPSLARAAGGADGRTYAVRARAGVAVSGSITTTATMPRDTMITPTHDMNACRRFVDRPFPVRDGHVGNAVVWISGVAEGPANDAPRRTTLALRNCQLEPRVQRVAAGGTVLVHSFDAISARLRFRTVGTASLRATVQLNDDGQVVPTPAPAASAGLVEVRDDKHPWVRGFLAVGLHPFVAVTDDDGAFRFTNVPPGRYTLVVWHERLGTHTEALVVAAGDVNKDVILSGMR